MGGVDFPYCFHSLKQEPACNVDHDAGRSKDKTKYKG